MSDIHTCPDLSGGPVSYLPSFLGELPGTPSDWRRKLEDLKEPGEVRFFLTVGDCLAFEAGTRKGRRLHDTTETGGRLPEDAIEQAVNPEALRILGGKSLFRQNVLPLAMAYANALERERQGVELEDAPGSGPSDFLMLMYKPVKFSVGVTPEMEERNGRIFVKCRDDFIRGMREKFRALGVGPSAVLPPWRVARLSQTAADVAEWSPQDGATWEQAGARYALSVPREPPESPLSVDSEEDAE